ncbi:hypothetical protein FOMPIDRAFT_1053606 [Fomitopsis schrenkii]|uniref:Uncharacterized protein n=1 Tax=Fomitopsis schrenkii TaxID=2126942 RepID=S8DY23_FOMSC|nr:hypothetical protein FOMPIDRAFT_1053606 [Fomitopsis schrenkii]
MARQAPQPSRYMGGEDFSDALDGVYGDAEDLGDEGNNEIAADAPDVPPSSLVPPEPSRIKIPPPGAPAERYRLVMMNYQVENGELRELITRLFAENQLLRAQLNRPAERTSVQSGSSVRQPAGWTPEWNNYTRQYLLFVAPWPCQGAFGMAARPPIDPQSMARYADDRTMRAAEAAELYDLIPRKYHPVLSRTDSGFVNMFRKKVQGARSNLLATLITHAGQVFDMPASLFNRNASSSRESDLDIQRLIRDADGKYGPFARVLFPAGEDKIEMKHIFLSVYLVRILLLMLFGPQSLGSSASGTTMGQAPIGKKWKVKQLTPGLLALACLFLIYILSADTALHQNKPGDKTSIDYAALFELLKRVYIGLSPERKYKVDSYFAQHVFHNTLPAPLSETSPSFSIEDGLLAINEPSLVLDGEPDLDLDDGLSISSDGEPHGDEHANPASEHPARTSSSISSRSVHASSRATAPQLPPPPIVHAPSRATAGAAPQLPPPPIMPVPPRAIAPVPPPAVAPVPPPAVTRVPPPPAMTPVPPPAIARAPPPPAIARVPPPPAIACTPPPPAMTPVPPPAITPVPMPAVAPVPPPVMIASPPPLAIDPVLPPAVASPYPLVSAPAPVNVAAGGSGRGKRRDVTGINELSSAVRDLVIEAYAPAPFMHPIQGVPGPEAPVEAPAVRRGRSAKKVELTPVIAPIPGDTPQVLVAAPPPKRKRKQQL